MIRYFTAHPTIANLLMIGFLASGIILGPTLLRETFPRAVQNEVEVSVIYPGARPEDIEDAICGPIESALDAVTGIERHSCEAREGLARANVKMQEGEDYQAFVANVSSEIEAISDLPERAEPPRIRTLGQTDPVVSVAVTGPDDLTDLYIYAEELRTRMLRWGGIPKVDITGFATREYLIGLDPTRLREFGISVVDVSRAIQTASLDLPAGSLNARSETILLRVNEERRTIEDLAALVVRSSEAGGQVLLGDLAALSVGFSETDDRVRFDGRPAAILDISKTARDDALRIIDRLSLFLEQERLQAPPTVTMDISSDSASVVRERLMLVVVNGIQGLALVFLVLWAFFGFRFSFWVAMGLPVSFMGGVALMWAVGYSLNLMTTLGLLIVIGLLMDDAIVIAENIARLRQQGRTALEAAIEGASQVFPNVLASFATTAMIFGSLAFLKGDLGAILRVVPVVMLFVLFISLIEAFLILPHHLVHSLETPPGASGISARADQALAKLRDRMIGPLVDLSIRWRHVTAGITVAVLLFSVSLLAGGTVKFVAFPELDGDVVVARVLMPQGTPLSRSEAVAARIEDGLAMVNDDLTPGQPEGATLVRHVSVLFGVNRDAFEGGENVVTISADLLPSADRNVRPDEILRRWRAAVGPVPDAIAVNYDEATIGPAGIAIDLRLRGEDLADLDKAASDLSEWLWRYHGVTSVLADLRPGKRELQIRLNDVAGTLGVPAATVADQLRAAYSGATVSEMQVNGDTVEVTAQFDGSALADFERFEGFDVFRPDGTSIPLDVIANVSTETGYNRINRENGQRTVTVQGKIDTTQTNANAIVADTLARFVPGLLERYPNVSVAVEGQNAEAGKTQGSMVLGFAVGLLGVFLLLSFQFRSYIEPLVVMLIIPLSLTGAILGHLLMGLDFSMPSMLGFLALAGVVVNNSILLVSFIKDEHGSAETVAEAAGIAARARFRAIFLTSLTTVAGLTPILLETSLQAQILIPLVASLVFGLLYASLAVLFVLPALYSILDDFGLSTLARERRWSNAIPD